MKVTLIRTGGTIGCKTDENGVIALEESVCDDVLRYFDGFDLTAVTPFYELSERLGVRHYDLLLKAAVKAIAGSDAAVITHGSDTLPYTASVLAFALGKVDIPVVFVCSDKPLSCPTASGHLSLSSAAKFLRTGSGGVFVADGNDVHFGVRLLEDRAYDEGFYSAFGRTSARVTGGRVRFFETFSNDERIPALKTILPKKILYIKPYPDMDYSAYDYRSFDCVLHDSYHSGTADERKLNAFAERCPCPLFLVGGSGGRVYSSKAGFSPKVTVIDNITLPAMYAKLLVGLNRFDSGDELKEYLNHNFCGEFFA